MEVVIHGGGDTYKEGTESVESEDELILSYLVLVHHSLAQVAEGSDNVSRNKNIPI